MPITHLAVIDLEGSGLNVDPPRETADEILEVGMVVLDAASLEEVYRNEWLVLPRVVAIPNTTNAFYRWAQALRDTNPFVFDMHSKETPPDSTHLIGRPSLLASLRAVSGTQSGEFCNAGMVQGEIIDAINKINPPESTDDKEPRPPGYVHRIHPGNSTVMFAGNSISNYDIPLLRMWMPDLIKRLSYRIMDLSVLRTFLVELARTPLPEKLNLAIKSGGGGHRALSDALYCANSLREIVAHNRAAYDIIDCMRGVVSDVATNFLSDDLRERANDVESDLLRMAPNTSVKG